MACRVIVGHVARALRRSMGVGGGGWLLATTAVVNFLAGLILGAQRPAAAPEVAATSCSVTEQCFQRLENGARYQLALECGGGLLAVVLACIACIRLCGGCVRVAGASAASATGGILEVFPSPRRRVTASQSAVRPIPSASPSSAAAAEAAAVEPEAPPTFTPKRLRGKQQGQ